MKYLILVLSSCFVFGLFSCGDGDGGGGKEKDSLNPTQISFTLDSIEYKWTEGYEGPMAGGQYLDSSAQGWFDGDILNLVASPIASFIYYSGDPADYYLGDPADIIKVEIEVNSTDEYAAVTVDISGDAYDTYSGNLTFDITALGEVGEFIVGTFTGTIYTGSDASVEHDVTNGSFKVIRLFDEFPN